MTRPAYGVNELAAILDISPALVSQWRTRGKLPEPTWVVSGIPVWHGAVIERWLRARKAAG